MSNQAESPCRLQFEEWISAAPYEKSVERYPDKPELFAWPGGYRCISVELSWEAWSEAWEEKRSRVIMSK